MKHPLDTFIDVVMYLTAALAILTILITKL